MDELDLERLFDGEGFLCQPGLETLNFHDRGVRE
jgi:hypothetical protein